MNRLTELKAGKDCHAEHASYMRQLTNLERTPSVAIERSIWQPAMHALHRVYHIVLAVWLVIFIHTVLNCLHLFVRVFMSCSSRTPPLAASHIWDIVHMVCQTDQTCHPSQSSNSFWSRGSRRWVLPEEILLPRCVLCYKWMMDWTSTGSALRLASALYFKARSCGSTAFLFLLWSLLLWSLYLARDCLPLGLLTLGTAYQKKPGTQDIDSSWRRLLTITRVRTWPVSSAGQHKINVLRKSRPWSYCSAISNLI